MQVVGASRLPEVRRKHRRAEGPLKAWLQEVKTAQWATPADLQVWFPAASILEEGNLVSFPIKDSRLLVRVDYSHRLVRIERLVEAEIRASEDHWELSASTDD